MGSTYKLVWSEEALTNLQGIIDYLGYRWSEREIQNFARILDRKLNLILTNPLMFAQSEISVELRKVVLSKQTTIHFRIENAEIHIITLFDNRQNPDNLSRFET